MTDDKRFSMLLYFCLLFAKKIAATDLEDVPAMPHLRYSVLREEFLIDAMNLPLDVDPVILASVAYSDLGDLRPLINQIYNDSRQRRLNSANFGSLQMSLVMLIIQWNRDGTTQAKDIARLMKLYNTSLPTPEASNPPPSYEPISMKLPSCDAAWNTNIISNHLRGKTRLSEVNDVMDLLPGPACISAHLFKIMINHIQLDKKKRQCEMNLIRKIDDYINNQQTDKDDQLVNSILRLILQINFFFEEKALARNGDFTWDQHNKMWSLEAIQYSELISPVVLGNLKFLPILATHQILSFYDRCFENGYYPENFQEWDGLLARGIKEWKKNNIAVHKLYVVINRVMMLNSRWILSDEQKTPLITLRYYKPIQEGYNPTYNGKKEFNPEDLTGKSKLTDIKNVIDTLPFDVSLQLTMIECWTRRNDQIKQIEEEIIQGIQQFLSAQGTVDNLRTVVLTAFDSALEKFAEAITEKSMEVEDDSKTEPAVMKLFGKQISFSRIKRQVEDLGKDDDSPKATGMELFGRQISLSRVEKLSVVEIAIQGFPFHADVNWTSTWDHFLNVMDLPTKAHPIVMDSLLILPTTVRTMIMEAYYTCHEVFAPEFSFKLMEKTLISTILEWRSSFFDISKKNSMLTTAKNLRHNCSAAMADKIPGLFHPTYRPISESILCDNQEIGKFDASVLINKTRLSVIKNVIMALPADSCVRIILMRHILAKMKSTKMEKDLVEIEKSVLKEIGDYLENKNRNKLAVNLANLSIWMFEIFENQYSYEMSKEDEAVEFMKILIDFKSKTAKYKEETPPKFMYPSVLRIKRHLSADYQEKLQTLYKCLADEEKIDKTKQDSIQGAVLAVMLNFIETSDPQLFQSVLNSNLQLHCNVFSSEEVEPSRKRLNLGKEVSTSGETLRSEKKSKWE